MKRWPPRTARYRARRHQRRTTHAITHFGARTIIPPTARERPQTNGKVDRFHRILLEEWAYIRPWTSGTQRATAYTGFIHFYNHHRPHGSLRWATPTSILREALPEEHT